MENPKEINKNPENVELMHIKVKNEQELMTLMDDDEYDVYLKELNPESASEGGKDKGLKEELKGVEGDKLEENKQTKEGVKEIKLEEMDDKVGEESDKVVGSEVKTKEIEKFE